MAKITNPKKQCKTTPESFSGESEIERVDRRDYRQGVILDSPEEFGQAIVVYDGGSVQGARATQNNLMDAIGNQFGEMGTGLLLFSGAKNAEGFTERLINEAVSSLQKKGRFHKSFDYDAMGTNFFKTTIEGNKVGDKYVLGLCAAYVGREPEGKLAETIGKPMALVSSNAEGRLSVVDDWWFNLNLEDAVKSLPLPNEALKNVNKWAQYFASGGFDEAPKFEFEHESRKFSLLVGLNTDNYLRPEGGEYGSEYMQARGKSIVGGAWTTWAENRNDKCEPRIVKPSLVYSVSLSGEGFPKTSAVTSEEMEAVQGARNYIADLIESRE